MSLGNGTEERLNRVFADYRSACPEIEPGANFMPSMWQKIEARRSAVFAWAAMSRRVLLGAVGLCVIFGFLLNTGISHSMFYTTTYVEALEDDGETEDLATLSPVSYPSPGGGRYPEVDVK